MYDGLVCAGYAALGASGARYTNEECRQRQLFLTPFEVVEEDGSFAEGGYQSSDIVLDGSGHLLEAFVSFTDRG